MKHFFHTLSQSAFTIIGSGLLVLIAGIIIMCGLGLTALYLVKHVDMDTPEIKNLQCMIGFMHPDCPQYNQEMDELKAKLETLTQQTAQAESKLANLRAIENTVDEVTLFSTEEAPDSTHSITVGTVYTHLLEPELSPKYFCYISLDNGAVNEDRSLYFRNKTGWIELDAKTLRKAGVSSATMEFARSICKPLIIGRE